VIPFAEGTITQLRREVKALLEPDEAVVVVRRLMSEIGPAGPLTRIVAVYFDAPGGPLGKRAVRKPRDCVKVRVKAYHPDLAGPPGALTLEVKRERGSLTSKERRRIGRGDVRNAIAELGLVTSGALAPCVATAYRRVVFQRTDGWRVTIDQDLAFHGASWAIFEPGAAPWPGALGPPVGGERRVVLELKLGHEAPPLWIAALATARAEPYSKFVEGLARAAPARSQGA
jgi:hypothetical protein